ncbi:regulator of replication initiation timing [Dysgonomonadaceae bacterium PH5-43]|nr:regulator of replication initiation timing [Dysgonomonadaceae bacterium PH5-43]
MSNYYCFISGLHNVDIGDERITYSVKDFRTELEEVLSKTDKKIIELFYLQFENKNLLHRLQNKEIKDEDIESLSPYYLRQFAEAYIKGEPINENLSWEDQLSALYYEYASKCKNKFVASWFEFNLNLNNMLITKTCKKYNWNTDAYVIGSIEDAEFEYSDFVSRIFEENNLQERELQIDVLRWEWLEENSFFHYFSVEQIFVYLIKLEIIERWVGLDPEEGQRKFRQIIDRLKKEIQ